MAVFCVKISEKTAVENENVVAHFTGKPSKLQD
jgi:hypothetical protein